MTTIKATGTTTTANRTTYSTAGTTTGKPVGCLLTARMLAACALLCLFLAACNGSEPASPPSKTQPLDATGLVLKQGEAPEEILKRAYLGDAQAASLAMLGYARGMGGFPQSAELAKAWADHTHSLNAYSTFCFNQLFLMSEGISTMAPACAAAHCETAEESSLAPAFKKAGVFDMKAYCSRLSPPDSVKDPEAAKKWHEVKEKERERIVKAQEILAENRKILHSDVIIDDETAARLMGHPLLASNVAMIFLLGTPHLPDAEPGSFSPEYAEKAYNKALSRFKVTTENGRKYLAIFKMEYESYFPRSQEAFNALQNADFAGIFRAVHTGEPGYGEDLTEINQNLVDLTFNYAVDRTWVDYLFYDDSPAKLYRYALAISKESRFAGQAWQLASFAKGKNPDEKTAHELDALVKKIEADIPDESRKDWSLSLERFREIYKKWTTARNKTREYYGLPPLMSEKTAADK